MLKSLIQEKYENQHKEHQYTDLIKDLLENGSLVQGRNGNTLCSIGCGMHFSLENNSIPILTTKKVAVKTCLKELIWFISAHTNNQLLNDQKVHIWDLNGTREFLDSRGLTENKQNDLGPIYGHQWRHFNAQYKDCHTDYTNQGVDQLQKVIDDLKNPETRYSRRHIVCAWNPCQLDEMALPPCHVLFQFHVTQGNKLSCTLYQRSGDVGLGVPFNIFSYSALTHLIAKHCGLEPYEFVYFLGNAHIYEDHIDALKEQVKNEPYPFPTMTIKEVKENINDYEYTDFEIHDYVCHQKVKMSMVQ
jgi:thymidylate synthase